jgi:hypothetical protein
MLPFLGLAQRRERDAEAIKSPRCIIRDCLAMHGGFGAVSLLAQPELQSANLGHRSAMPERRAVSQVEILTAVRQHRHLFGSRKAETEANVKRFYEQFPWRGFQ